MSAQSDYHAAKSQWLVENTTKDDLILTDYEPIMIFYLDYFCTGEVVNSGAVTREELVQKLGTRRAEAYALHSFFEPMASMLIRHPEQYARMVELGSLFRPEFVLRKDDEFGGIWKLTESVSVGE